MKTAEEWMIQEYFNIADVDTSTMLALIKQIQLDAMKEGMRRAAELMWKDRERMRQAGEETDGANTYYAILTAAEQLTEKDL